MKNEAENIDKPQGNGVLPCVIGGLSSSRNFSEDFKDENGCYQNECRLCHKTFLGYKYRRICKECVIADSNPQAF